MVRLIHELKTFVLQCWILKRESLLMNFSARVKVLLFYSPLDKQFSHGLWGKI